MGPPRKGAKSGMRGHGPSDRLRRFAVTVNRCVRGQPMSGKASPWFLKQWGSRPSYKLKRLLAEVA